MGFKNEVIKFAALAMIALGAGPLGAALWQWSTTPASNTNSDPTINWSVGMAPSAVSPSARAMMARIAEYRDDTSGALASTGGPVTFAVTTNASAGGNPFCPSGGVPANGTQIALTLNALNGTNPTLTVDGCSAEPIQQSTGTAPAPSAMLAGSPYRFTFSTANTAWMLQNGPSNVVPIGGLIPYVGTGNAPAGYIYPVGQCLSQTTQGALYALMGSPGVGSCSAGQFNAPDVRGRVVAMLDSFAGQYGGAGRLTSSANGCGTAMSSLNAACANGNESTALTTAALPAYTPSGSIGNGAITTTTSSSVTNGVVGENQTSQWQYAGFDSQDNICCFTIGITSSSSSSQAASSFTGNAQGGSSSPFPRVMPTIGEQYIMRIN
jgi:hypothetical protein